MMQTLPFPVVNFWSCSLISPPIHFDIYNSHRIWPAVLGPHELNIIHKIIKVQCW